MINFLPELYPDELFYSWILRYHHMNGYKNYERTNKKLFGSRTRISLRYASKLDFFCNQLPQNSCYTPDFLIINHTLLPFFQLVISKEKMEVCKSIMRSENITPITSILMQGFETQRGINFCPQCVVDDKKKFGETYIHRTHQIPGYYVCSVHKIPLKRLNILDTVTFYYKFNFNKAVNDMRLIENYDIDSYNYKFYHDLSCDLEHMFKLCDSNISFDSIRDVYKRKLFELGFMKHIQRINQEKIDQAFRKLYPASLLSNLGRDFDSSSWGNWLRRMCNTKKDTVNDPVKHMLFINFLFGSFNSFIKSMNQYNSEKLIFGEGPWPCLNPAAGHYRENVVTECNIHRGSWKNNIVGTFACDCGFIYARKGPEESSNERFTYTRVISYGREWEDKLICLIYDDTKYMMDIEKIMGCSHKTLVTYSKKLGVFDIMKYKSKDLRKAALSSRKKPRNMELKEQYLYDIKQLLLSDVNCTDMIIKKTLTKQYYWLLRYFWDDLKKVISMYRT